MFWLVGLLLGFVATGWLIKRFERGGRRVVTSTLFTLTAMEMVAMLVFALTGSTWLAIAALLGVFFARDLAGPLYTIWLNEQIRDSSVRATVLSISGQANAIGQAGGGPVLGAIGNVWGIRAALAAGRRRDRARALRCTAARSPTTGASRSSRSYRPGVTVVQSERV